MLPTGPLELRPSDDLLVGVTALATGISQKTFVKRDKFQS
jgi:hypothetical protein